MTRYPAEVPTWGVLVQAPVTQVKQLMVPLGDRFELRHLLYRTNGPWTAVFNMEPGSTGANDAVVTLKDHGLAPVYHFDFNKYEYVTWKWDGVSSQEDDDPANVLGGVGIEIPGHKKLGLPSDPRFAIVSRDASVLEGMTVAEARRLVPSELRVEAGPRGAIVYDPDVNLQGQLWQTATGRVFELLFYPDSGKLRVRIMKGEECLGTFRPGETGTWDGTPFLADIDGETSPERIIEMFGLDHSFLAPLEQAHPSQP